jgi:ferrous-iron efflux pump FieF
MDREWPDARRQAFVAVAARHPANRGTHDLRTRSSGARNSRNSTSSSIRR